MTTRKPPTDRTLTPAGERLLAVATDLFYERGIRAVGVEEIAEVAGTTKKTLYDQFRSKDQLVATYLRRRSQRWRAFCTTHLDEHAPEPGLSRVLAVYDALGRWHGENQRGCAFVNAWAELGGTTHPGATVVRDDKRWMHDLFERVSGEIPGTDASVLGGQLHLLYEGALVISTAGGRADAVGDARSAAALLVQAATTPQELEG